ncbi:MAG: metalloregulator ArsR/SmtB family transcription factor [Rhodospirillaceae bacterium]|jgi:rhodanese-related sulfurtransferase|nr:metalloregulator ArsR/SmtB family transcription factor [Rhodospirillaceae bacterium]MBT5014206.1 metalloregulator ArsR/SmtB family transcription factor [Rhodospirillaceae bacterium]MBT5309040.1 metalloregulator ArsR/SmtB family transcription factor [Rhodospirillaceae bacterium]MBT7357028.1 metalloregulator ArsR/SmtB family transcription factor [Rhodospirillaceae bacterium]
MSKNISVKKALFEQFAQVAKAMAHANRLELLEFLAQGERTVEVLADLTGISVANASQHLRQLLRAGLVGSRKEGQYVHYSLADLSVVTLMDSLRTVAESNLSEVDHLVDTYLKTKDSLEPVSHEELLSRSREGLVTVLDVRPPEEYEQGHVDGAINIPLADLKRRIDELPRGQEVVAYCRGPYCVLAYDAVAELRARGMEARRLDGGLPEWRNAGLPVA